jgi:hypothetical protein
LELECATGCRAETRSISKGKAGLRSCRSRQIKIAGRNFYLEIELQEEICQTTLVLSQVYAFWT